MTGSPYLDDQGEILAMTSTLAEIGYRDLSRHANQRRLSVARRLHREGLSDRLLRMLWRYAEACGSSPVRLFAYWVDRPELCVAKCNEMRERSDWAQRVVREEARAEVERDVPAVIHDLAKRRQA